MAGWYAQSLIIVRYSEIGLKGARARRRMESLLRRNISAGLSASGEKCGFRWERGRLFLDGYSNSAVLYDVLSRTMGVKSFSEVVSLRFKHPDEIARKAVALYSGTVAGRKFAVRSRRAGGQNFNSVNLNVLVGDALFPFSAGVDLDNPEVEVSIEIRNDIAYFFTDTHKGPGGLPIGSEGNLVALVSGGIDSPVAAWMMLKRGSPLSFVFVSLAHPVDTMDFLESLEVLTGRWSHGYDPEIHIINGRILVEKMADGNSYTAPSVTFKRILYTVAMRIAESSGSFGIVTGESLGQVSSQTPENLFAINHGIAFPIYRPLIGMDKDEISDLARKIGTFPRNSRGEFCSLFSRNSIIGVTPDQVDQDMLRYDLVSSLLSSQEIIHGSGIREYMDSLGFHDMAPQDVTGDMVVVDLRSGEKFSQWHVPGALRAGIGDIKGIVSQFGTGKPYVFYCQKGLQSAFAATEARKMGALAYYTDVEGIRRVVAKQQLQQHLGRD